MSAADVLQQLPQQSFEPFTSVPEAPTSAVKEFHSIYFNDNDDYKFELCNYGVLQKIGEGTFGQVYKADFQDPETGEKRQVALKKLNLINEKEGFPITALREIRYLKLLDHENVVKLEKILQSKPSRKNKMRGSFYLVFEYLKHDLQGLINMKCAFTMAQLKCIMIQILQGIQYLHQKHVIHRDIKGANILLSSDGKVKLADFGLARVYYPGVEQVQYTNRVVTLWYRAPELLLGAKNYTEAIDMWSVGCVFAELVLQQVLFQGDKDEKQIELIYEKCGSVNNENWPGVQELRQYPQLGPKKSMPRKIKEILIQQSQGKITESLADLIDKLLQMDPKKRISATNALKHDFFTTELPKASLPKELTNLQEQDFHEFIVKMNRKHQGQFKSKFAFARPCQPSTVSNAENTVQDNRDYWIPAFEQGNKQRYIFSAKPTTDNTIGISVEEARNMPVKPFQNPQLVNQHQIQQRMNDQNDQQKDQQYPSHSSSGGSGYQSFGRGTNPRYHGTNYDPQYRPRGLAPYVRNNNDYGERPPGTQTYGRGYRQPPPYGQSSGHHTEFRPRYPYPPPSHHGQSTRPPYPPSHFEGSHRQPSSEAQVQLNAEVPPPFLVPPKNVEPPKSEEPVSMKPAADVVMKPPPEIVVEKKEDNLAKEVPPPKYPPPSLRDDYHKRPPIDSKRYTTSRDDHYPRPTSKRDDYRSKRGQGAAASRSYSSSSNTSSMSSGGRKKNYHRYKVVEVKRREIAHHHHYRRGNSSSSSGRSSSGGSSPRGGPHRQHHHSKYTKGAGAEQRRRKSSSNSKDKYKSISIGAKEDKPKEVVERRVEVAKVQGEETKKGSDASEKIEISSQAVEVGERSITKLPNSQDTRREPPPKYYQSSSSKHYDSKYLDSRDTSRPPHTYKRDYYQPSSSSGGYRDDRDQYSRKEYPPRDDHHSSSVTFRYSAAESRVVTYPKEGEKRLQYSEYVKKNQSWYDDRSNPKDRPVPSYSKASAEKDKGQQQSQDTVKPAQEVLPPPAAISKLPELDLKSPGPKIKEPEPKLTEKISEPPRKPYEKSYPPRPLDSRAPHPIFRQGENSSDSRKQLDDRRPSYEPYKKIDQQPERPRQDTNNTESTNNRHQYSAASRIEFDYTSGRDYYNKSSYDHRDRVHKPPYHSESSKPYSGSTSARKYDQLPQSSYERRQITYGASKRSRSRSKERPSSIYHKDSGANREVKMVPASQPAQKRKDSAGAGSEEGEIKKKSS